MKNGFTINMATLPEIQSHFSLCSESFIKHINKRILLNEYILKIFEYATLYEYWNESELVGLAAIYQNRGIQEPAYLTTISVIEQFQQKGIAARLLDCAIKRLKNAGFLSLHLEVKRDNDIAINLYKRFGFEFLSEKTPETILMKLLINNYGNTK